MDFPPGPGIFPERWPGVVRIDHHAADRPSVRADVDGDHPPGQHDQGNIPEIHAGLHQFVQGCNHASRALQLWRVIEPVQALQITGAGSGDFGRGGCIVYDRIHFPVTKSLPHFVANEYRR